jgi:hypothetical protein
MWAVVIAKLMAWFEPGVKDVEKANPYYTPKLDGLTIARG